MVQAEEDGAGDGYSEYGTTKGSGCAMLQGSSISTAGNRAVRAAFTVAQQGLQNDAFILCVNYFIADFISFSHRRHLELKLFP